MYCHKHFTSYQNYITDISVKIKNTKEKYELVYIKTIGILDKSDGVTKWYLKKIPTLANKHPK